MLIVVVYLSGAVEPQRQTVWGWFPHELECSLTAQAVEGIFEQGFEQYGDRRQDGETWRFVCAPATASTVSN